MKWKLAFSLALASLLAVTATRAQESLRAFGLEFTVISNAVVSLDGGYFKVIQVGGPECSDDPPGTNELDNLPFGISVHLGEAQSGVYVYPYSECRLDRRSMWGNAYGNVNGETNRLISYVKGTRAAWGEYDIEVDLSPLGATSYTYQVWSHGLLTMHATNQSAFSGIYTINVEDYDPRVNPIVVTDLGPAVLIEFPDGTQFQTRGGQSSGAYGASAVGDRFFIIAEGATNHVNYVSRVDVFGSADLPSFEVSDARIGMFGRPHKAWGGVQFTAAGGHLTAGPFENSITDGPNDGILVDFKNGALRWSAQTLPFTLGETNAQLFLSSSGLGSSDRPVHVYSGPAGFFRSNRLISLSADFTQLQTSNSILRVYRGHSLSGTILGANGTVLATLADTNPMVTGWAAVLESFSISILEPTRVTAHDGTLLDGDRFEFAPFENAVRVGRNFGTYIFAQGTPGFTIVSEVTEDAPTPELRLNIEHSPTGLMVSWPYQPYVYIVARTNLTTEYQHSVGPAQFRDFRWYIPVDPTNRSDFYSLRHVYHYYILRE